MDQHNRTSQDDVVSLTNREYTQHGDHSNQIDSTTNVGNEEYTPIYNQNSHISRKNDPKGQSYRVSSSGYKYVDWDNSIPSTAKRNTRLHPSQRSYFPQFHDHEASCKDFEDADEDCEEQNDFVGHNSQSEAHEEETDPNEQGFRDSEDPPGHSTSGTNTRNNAHKEKIAQSHGKGGSVKTIDGIPRKLRPLYQEYVRLYTQTRDPWYDPVFTLDSNVAALEHGWDDRAGPSAAHLSTLMHKYHHYMKASDCPSTLAGPRSLIVNPASTVPSKVPKRDAFTNADALSIEEARVSTQRNGPQTSSQGKRLVGKGRNPAIERCKSVVRMYLNEAGGRIAKARLHQTDVDTLSAGSTLADVTGHSRTKRMNQTRPSSVQNTPPLPPSQPRPLTNAGVLSIRAAKSNEISSENGPNEENAVKQEGSGLDASLMQNNNSLTADAHAPNAQESLSNNGKTSTSPTDESQQPQLFFELVLPSTIPYTPSALSSQRKQMQSAHNNAIQRDAQRQMDDLNASNNDSSTAASASGENSMIVMVPKLPKLPKSQTGSSNRTAVRWSQSPISNSKAAHLVIQRLEENERKKHWDATLFGFTANRSGNAQRTSKGSAGSQSSVSSHGVRFRNQDVHDRSTTPQPSSYAHASHRPSSQVDGIPLNSASDHDEMDEIDRELARIQEEKEKIRSALLATTSRKTIKS